MNGNEDWRVGEQSNLVDHAERELTLAGLFGKDADYDGELAHGVMRLMRTFSKEDHSGMSAAMSIDLFQRLANFENLIPLTNNPDDWADVSEHCEVPTFQCKRNGSCFSTDNLKTYYNINESSDTHHDLPDYKGEK